MAEFASGIAGKILQKLASLANGETRLALNIKIELRKLEGTMTTIEAVLLDAEEKQASNSALSIWLRQLKDIFYEAEDLLGEVEYEVQRKQTSGRTSGEVSAFFSCCTVLAFRSELGLKSKNIRERLRNTAANKDQVSLMPRLEDRQRGMTTHSFVPPSDVIGRNNDIKNIIDLLMDPNDNTNVNVIPIVGIGGLGKTTLAKLVYHDERVTNHFEFRMWVRVYEDFDDARLVTEILESASGEIIEVLTVDLRKTHLRVCLWNKKFLLVFR